MTKALHLVHQNYFRDARVKRYVQTLAGTGARVDVLCVRDEGQSDIDLATGARVFTIPLVRGDGGKQGYFLEYGKAFLYYFIWVSWLFLRNRYQLIHVHNMPDFLVFAAFLPRLFGAKIILDIHDPTPEFYMSKFAMQDSLMVRVMRFQERLSTRFVHAVITANDNFKNNLIDRGVSEKKIFVVVNMPDLAIFDRSVISIKDRKKNGDFVLLYPGTIARRYGLEIAVRAIPALLPDIPAIKLVIVGKQSEYAEVLREIAVDLNITSSIDVRGPVASEQVPRLMETADVGIYPALADPHMNIAIPTKVLEYAAMGLPIVASKLPVIDQLFPNGGILFSAPGNIEEFAEAILKLFQSKDLRTKMVETVDRELKKRGSWQQEGSIYKDLVSELMA